MIIRLMSGAQVPAARFPGNLPEKFVTTLPQESFETLSTCRFPRHLGSTQFASQPQPGGDVGDEFGVSPGFSLSQLMVDMADNQGSFPVLLLMNLVQGAQQGNAVRPARNGDKYRVRQPVRRRPLLTNDFRNRFQAASRSSGPWHSCGSIVRCMKAGV